MDLVKLKALYRYDGRVGRLYQGRELVKATPKTPGGPLLVRFDGKLVKYARICFALAHGYLPRQVRHENGRLQDNRQRNLYDPDKRIAEASALAHSGKYRGVHEVTCQYSGRFRGFRGSVYKDGRRYYTPVAETPEQAKALRDWLVMSLEAK